MRDANPEAIARAPCAQLADSERFAHECALPQPKSNACIPAAISAASVKSQTVATEHMANQLGIGGSQWLGQFAFGFPITGRLSQKRPFPTDHPKMRRLSAERIFRPDAARFGERDANSVRKNAQPMRREAMEQVGVGWLLPPTPLSSGGKHLTWRSDGCNISFRLGVHQSGKLRDCDDLKRSVANIACAVTSRFRWNRGEISPISRASCRPRAETG